MAEKLKGRRRSLLGSVDLNINDIVKSEKISESDKLCKVSNVFSKPRIPVVDDHRELFEGLEYKKLGSIETTDCEETSFEEKRVIQSFNENSLEREKIKLQLEKIEKGKTEKKKNLTEPIEKFDSPNITTLKYERKDIEICQTKNAMRFSTLLNAQTQK